MQQGETQQTDGEHQKRAELLEWMAGAGRHLVTMGYRVIPLSVMGKDPIDIGWQSRVYSADEIAVAARDQRNLGILYGQPVAPGKLLCALDLDITRVDIMDQVLRVLNLSTPIREGNAPKKLAPIILDDAIGFNRDFVFINGENDRQCIQVLGRGQRPPAGPKQAVAIGVHPKTERLYTWSMAPRLYSMRPGDWDYFDAARFDAAMAEITKIMGSFGYVPRARAARLLGDAEEYKGPIDPKAVEDEKRYTQLVIESFKTMAPGNRGTEAHKLGLRIGLLVRRGYIDLEEVAADILNAMPDNHNAPREFERGVFRSVGGRQKVVFESRQTDWSAFLQQGPALKGAAPGADPAAEPGSDEREEWRDTYRHVLIDGGCDIIYDGLRERGAEKATAEEALGRSFLASLLAAGTASVEEISAKWGLRALKLTGINTGRYGHEAKRVESELKLLQPTEPGWADYACFLMAKRGMSPGKAIRGAQHGHKTHAATREARESAGEQSVEAEIISENSSQQTWDMDSNGNAEGASFSNFKFFMSSQLWVWPFVDDWSERVVYRRLVRYDDSRDIITDAQLTRWSANPGDAANEIYALARDRQKSWGTAGYTPHHGDVERWLNALVGDGRGRRFNSVVERMKVWPEWDGIERLGTWLPRYVGCMPWDRHYDYVRIAGAHFLRNWAYRLENPGHKWDEVLVVVGLQGERKTTLFRVLADAVEPGSYLEGQRLDFENKTGINRLAEITRGKTLVEMAELTSLGRRDIEHVKAMISSTTDTGRRTYGSTTIDKARQFGLVGTANCTIPHMSGEAVAMELHSLPPIERNKRKRELMMDAEKGFLTDGSGNRRFHPVLVFTSEIDLEMLAGEVIQLIAEARAQVAADPKALRLSSSDLVLIATATREHHATNGLTEDLAARLAPITHLEHVKMRMADIRALMGLQAARQGHPAAQLRAAVEDLGFSVYKSMGVMWAVRGDKAKATQAPIIEGSGAVRLAVGSAGGFGGAAEAQAAAE